MFILVNYSILGFSSKQIIVITILVNIVSSKTSYIQYIYNLNTYITIYFRYVESDEPTWRGYLYIVALVVVTIVNTIINAQALFMQYGIGLRIKTSLISAIYRKSLKLSSAGRKEMTGKDLLKYFFLILFKIF